MRAGVAGIAAEGAVSAIVAAKVGERQKHLARICDNPGLEALLRGASGGEEFGKIFVGAANQLDGGFARDRFAGAGVGVGQCGGDVFSCDGRDCCESHGCIE